jgi:hypothetical protein
MRLWHVVTLAILMISVSPVAEADTVYFMGSVGNLNSSSATFNGLITVNGFYLNNGSWAGANLFGRNQTTDHGLGVCNPVQSSSCGTGIGYGDINELDNAQQSELMRLTLPAGYRWVSVQLSSLDNNGGGTASPERGQLYASSSIMLGTTAGNLGGPIIWQFQGTGPVEPTFLIPSAYANSRYLFFEPYDWANGGKNRDNDFLVYSSTIVPVPEPTALSLVGPALVVLWLKMKKHKA